MAVNVFLQINIFINRTKLKQGVRFKYLRTLISSDGRNDAEITSIIAQPKIFQRMKFILINRYISIQPRKRAQVVFSIIHQQISEAERGWGERRREASGLDIMSSGYDRFPSRGYGRSPRRVR